MRIVVCSVQVPFIAGGAELHIASLIRELQQRGHEVENICLPFQWLPHEELIKGAFLWRCLEIPADGPRRVDLVIATKFPSYLVRHPRKVTWLLHQHRQIYDLLHHPFTDFNDSLPDLQVRRLLYDCDSKFLRESQRIFTNSRTVAARLLTFNGIAGEPLYHPPMLKDRLRHIAWEDSILSVGRLELNKRVDLLLEAMPHMKTPWRVKIVGEGPQMSTLQALAAALQMTDRVEFCGKLPQEVLLELYGRCSAVYYAPYDEDLGYVTMEAFFAGKPVVSCSDAGGVLEFLEPDLSGLVTPPDPAALAAAFDSLYGQSEHCQAMGEHGRSRVADISWSHVIDVLTEELP